ncbi:class I SAM-dependent methyltransferase [Spirosoma sp. KCTC 42546]|uniref:class I SAM-dependent methyltransferase n=1 Tax=Spirosoma sp. KCTC 42546 TaxID=2520506 RepID=UPI001FED610B|nr:class I SAM-dependent methyltransferase [Spirosoma sp. KCTC 42546]
MGSAYRLHYEGADPNRYSNWLTTLVELLPANGRVLELGCADGIPTARYLSEYVDYVGIDLSSVQIEQARRNVPQAQFDIADMTTLVFPDNSFEGVVALYSIIHLPVAEQPDLLTAIHRWLKPAGYFLCVVGAGSWTGTDEDWISPGIRMYWSHADAATYQAWFIELGFTILDSHFVAEGEAGHTFFLLRK